MGKSKFKFRRRWQRGVSFGSAGRLGAPGAGFEPGENGYLTYQNAGPTFMLIRPDRLEPAELLAGKGLRRLRAWCGGWPGTGPGLDGSTT